MSVIQLVHESVSKRAGYNLNDVKNQWINSVYTQCRIFILHHLIKKKISRPSIVPDKKC